MTQQRGTDLPDFINDLDGSVYAEKVSRALSDVAAGVIETDKNGEVTLKFKLSRVGNSHRVTIKHSLNYKVPERNGNYSQENTTESVMHVNRGGKITVFPEDQGQLLTRTGDPANHHNEED